MANAQLTRTQIEDPAAGLSVVGRELLSQPVLRPMQEGLWCEAGDFYVDPVEPVARAVLTHAHGDHARSGNERYWCAEPGLALARLRLGDEASIEAVAYGASFEMINPASSSKAKVSFHPAGHILGSAQVRIEVDGVVWIASGDYKRALDPTCAPFESVQCDVFISEATFALPIYRWEPTEQIAQQILLWQDDCARRGRAALLYCYALGKAQRLAAEIARLSDRPIFAHGAVANMFDAYQSAGAKIPSVVRVDDSLDAAHSWAGELILAPPSAEGGSWTKRFSRGAGCAESGFASGWMRVRGNKRRRGYDRGFSLSDHADWPALLTTIKNSGARLALPTHGYADTLARALCERGIEAQPLAGVREDQRRENEDG